MKKIYKTLFLVLGGVFLPVAQALALNIQNPAPGLFTNTKGDGSFKALLGWLINDVMLPLAAVVAMMFVIIGGYQYMTSAGDEEAAAKGKKTLSGGVIGLVIIILSYTIITVVINALAGKV
jgi:uncharacterized membrane protein